MSRARENADLPVAMTETDGNVGIGTTPSRTLDVDGQLRTRNGGATGYALIEYGASATATNNWHVGSEGDGTYRFYNGNFGAGTERIRIDASGRVTTPSQPSFLARGITGQPSTGNAFVFNGADYNRGNCYSTANGRFTAPVNGFYIFTCHIMSDSTDGRLMIRLFKNGTHMSQGSSSSNSDQYQDSRIAFMMYMASGDYAEVRYQGNKGRYDNGPTHCHFAGHLLG